MHPEDVVAWFRPHPPAVSDARRFVREALAGLDPAPVGEDLLDTLIMAANELATNAVLHARTDFSVRVLIEPGWVRVEVGDANTRMPQACLAPSHATSGRGLAIIDGSGLQWGAERRAGGKIVWVQGRRQR